MLNRARRISIIVPMPALVRKEHVCGAKDGPARGWDREIAALATRQHGVVSRRQLFGLGLERGAVRHRIAAGRLHAVHRGVYSVGHRLLTARGRWMAAVLACGDDALLSHRSAAALWGFGTAAGSRIDVTIASRSRGRRPDVALHQVRSLDPDDRRSRSEIPLTSPARTLFDLAEVLWPVQLERAWEDAARLGLLDLAAVARLCEAATGRRGLGRLRKLLSESSAPIRQTRSGLERLFLRVCRDAGLPAPAVNVSVGSCVVDALWREQRLVVEVDSFAYHHSREAFERDRLRDTELQAAGYRVLRITDRRLREEPAAVVKPIRSLIGG